MKAFRGPGADRHIRSAALVLGLLLHMVAFASLATAQDMASTPVEQVEGSFDGMRFVGPFGPEAQRDPKEDVFIFEDGTFVSANCREMGFTPAPYWVRRDADGLHFLAELKDSEHGTMRYEGVFDGEIMSALMFWKKERWYWTVERTYVFTGKPAASGK